MHQELPTDLYSWYMAAKKNSYHRNMQQIVQSARWNREAYIAALDRYLSLSQHIRDTLEDWFDEFIRSEAVEDMTNERDSDFINEPERANRCYEGAEHGCDGKYHAEVIQDWRDALSGYMESRYGSKDHDRFRELVLDKITLCELWHWFNGSLWKEIG